VTHLLKAQSDVNITSRYGRTPLHHACMKRHIQLVTQLLGYNSNPNAKDSKGKTPLHHAVDHDEPPLAIVNILLKYLPIIVLLRGVGAAFQHQ
jgi:uncharacterized protein